jgi:hypothetical protein
VIWVAVIAAVTVVLSTALVAAAISVRPTTPCLFSQTIVFTRDGRYDGGKCTGPAENLYLSSRNATRGLDGVRVCNGHTPKLFDVADQLVREAA